MNEKHNSMQALIKGITLLLFSVFMHLPFAQAQTNFQEGYIVRTGNDTVRGFIDFRDWKKNPGYIRFKAENESSESTLRPRDIKMFFVEGERYVSAMVYIETSPYKNDQLKFDEALNLKSHTAFLQSIVNGPKSLYLLKAKNGRNNFYIKAKDEYVLLNQKRYFDFRDEKKVIVENREYLAQLKQYLEECPAIEDQIEKTDYGKRALRKLFFYYYDCVASEVTFRRTRDKLKTALGIMAGGTSTDLDFGGNFQHALQHTDYVVSTDVTAAVYLDLILPRNLRKWSIHNELQYTTFSTTGYYEDLFREDDYRLIDTKFEYSYLNINNLLRFTYSFDWMRVYINAGIANGLMLDETNYRYQKSFYFGIEDEEEGKALNGTRRYRQAWIVGLGVHRNSFTLDLRYENGNGMSDATQSRSSTKRFEVMLGYRIF